MLNCAKLRTNPEFTVVIERAHSSVHITSGWVKCATFKLAVFSHVK